MNKKMIVLTIIILCQNIMHAGYGGGFATGAILGTGLTLAATSGSRNANKDPYYEVDRERARQEAREIREETRRKREEDRARKKEEKELEQKRNRLKKMYPKQKMQPQSISTTRQEKIDKLKMELRKLELQEELEALQAG